ncbi:MAG: helix-turn-helix transcriptional regulator [Sulfuriflexus sp.]|nr:helix-turn-helix transcriptional regulator [Sulfuriflexus sp.]
MVSKTSKSRTAFGKRLKEVRQSKGFTQEDFAMVSSRSYISELERGIKSPTIEKIEGLCKEMGVHPLTLLSLTYLQGKSPKDMQKLLRKIENEANAILDEQR